MAKAPAMTIPSSKVEIALTAGSTEPAMKAAEAKAGKVFDVPVAAIQEIPGFNVRVDSPDYREHVKTIANSIEQNGYDATKPLAGYVHKDGDKNVIYLTDGHTRLAAVKSMGDKAPASLPVIVASPAPSLTDLTIGLHTRNAGRPLTPFELGVVVKRLLKEDGATKDGIASRLSVTPRYLDDVLLLVNSPKPVREAVLNGQVSSTMAIQELRKAGDEPQKATDRITAAVAKATAAGKTKATAKDTGAVKMKRIKTTVAIQDGSAMQDIVKAVAAAVRAAVAQKLDGEGDDAVKLAAVDGSIDLVILVPAPVKAAKKPKAAKKTGTKSSVTKPTATKEGGDAKPAAAKKPRAKKGEAAKPAPEPAGDDENISADDDDLGIPGATEVASAEGADDEIAAVPPAVKNGDGVDDSDVDI